MRAALHCTALYAVCDVQSLEREETSRQIAADWYTLVPQMGMDSGMAMGGRPQTAAGRIRVQLEWLPPGASSVSELNTTAHLNTGDAGGVGVGDLGEDPAGRVQSSGGGGDGSVGRAGTPLTMGPTTTRDHNNVKEDLVGEAQYAT